jgi:predicted Zn finger-like uncharacterized protein
MFKVVHAQLLVSDGWVRCGQCDEVFDANVHLQPSAQPVVAPTPPNNAVAAPAAYDWSEVAGMESPAAAVAPATAVETATAVAVLPGDAFLDQSPHALSGPSDAGIAVQDLSGAAAGAGAAPSFVHVAAQPTPSFMAQGKATSSRAGLAARVWMWSAAAALLGVLGGQVLWHERDRIASFNPSIAPALAWACSVFGCRIDALRQADALVIDSSSFSKVLTQVYTLQFTLRNTGSVPVAMPAVELTLTDLQDRVLLRRVLQAKEFAGQRPALPVGASVTASLPVQVRSVVGAESIAGYRLLAFYP